MRRRLVERLWTLPLSLELVVTVASTADATLLPFARRWICLMTWEIFMSEDGVGTRRVNSTSFGRGRARFERPSEIPHPRASTCLDELVIMA